MASSVYEKVSVGFVSRAQERRFLADLTGFPNLAAVLAFEETWRKNRKKKKRKRKKNQTRIDAEIASLIGRENAEQNDQEPSQSVAEVPMEQVIVIEDSDNEVASKDQTLKIQGEDMQPTELKENIEKETNDGIVVGCAGEEVIGRYISKADEYKILTDLTDFPYLAAMLAFEASWRRNRKKNKRKRETNDLSQNDNKKVSIEYVSRAEGHKFLADLTGFLNPAAMLAFKETWRKNRKKKKRRKKNQPRIETKIASLVGPENATIAAKEQTTTITCNVVETIKALEHGGSLGFSEVASICLPSSEGEVILDLDSSKTLGEIVLEDNSGVREENRIDEQEDIINILEEDLFANSGNERMPCQTGSVNMMDDILPRKLLNHQRYFNHRVGSRGIAEDDHVSVKLAVPKRKKSCCSYEGVRQNAKHCKQMVDSFVCCRIGQYANAFQEEQLIEDQSYRACLRCGNSGHDMFSCSNDYFPDDLKQVQCYACGASGHLCCVDYTNNPSRVSCYNCGQSSHAASDCINLLGRQPGLNSAHLFCENC